MGSAAHDRGEKERGITHRRQLDERGAVRERGGALVSGLECEACLAGASGAGQDEQPHVVAKEALAQLRQLALPSQQRIRSSGQLRRRCVLRRRDVEAGLLLENASLQLAQLAARLEPELVDQPRARRRVEVERLLLPAAAVERQHRLRLQPLAQRMLADEPLQLGQELRVPPQCQARFEALLDGEHAQLFQAFRLTPSELVVANSP